MSLFTLSGGAYTSEQSLIQLKAIAKHLNLLSPHRVYGTLAANSHTNIKGRGLSFAEVRSYQPGDDVRAIDWKVTARTGKTHTKIFHQEKSRPYLIIVDQSSSMFFGSEHAFKSVLAAQLASLIAWQVLASGDGLSAIITTNDQQHYIPLGYRQKNTLKFIHQLNQCNQQLNNSVPPSSTHLDITLKQAQQHARSGYSVIIISDFLYLSASSQQLLYSLRNRNSLAAILVYDKLEKSLPSYGSYTVNDSQHDYVLDANNQQVLHEYQQLFTQRISSTQKVFTDLNSKLSILDTRAHTSADLMANLIL
jgi:uncharacterized protein (DUF58 family)